MVKIAISYVVHISSSLIPGYQQKYVLDLYILNTILYENEYKFM